MTTRVICRLVVGLVLSAVPTSTIADTPTIVELARRTYIEGVPFDEVRQFKNDDVVPSLVGMLSDLSEEEHWANVVVILGMLGDDRAFKPLVQKLIEPPQIELSVAHWRALKSIPVSLGYLAFYGSQEALDYLIASLDVSVWQTRGVNWKGPIQPDAEARDRDLTKMAMLGLAVSGQSKAGEALTNEISRKGTVTESKGASFVSELLAEHAKVAAKGLDCYYSSGSCD